jgi:hypothetical protein
MKDALIGAVVTAAVSTVGDYLWSNVLPHDQPVYWFAHAIVLFSTLGACLGWPARRPLAGAAGAVIIGCAATLGFYLLRPVVGYAAAMFGLFFGMWLALGVLVVRVLQGRRGMADILTRSALAAVGSGLGFYLISGIWFPFDPRGWDYAVHFVSWIVAYFPAFAALLLRRPAADASSLG